MERRGFDLEIVVLLKQVPATETFVEIAGDGASIRTDGIKWVINPYDELAVEEALRIKEKHGGTVTVVSAGNEKTLDAVRTAFAMGADRGILINDPALKSCDGLGIAKILAGVLKTIPFDLVIAGQRAVDDGNFLVGPAAAEFLNIPSISMVIRAEVSDGVIRCVKTVDGGTMELEARLPLLFTTQRGLNEPRYASLPGIMKAKKKPLEVKTLADFKIETPSQDAAARVVAMNLPPVRKAGRIIRGADARQKAAELVKALREEAGVI